MIELEGQVLLSTPSPEARGEWVLTPLLPGRVPAPLQRVTNLDVGFDMPRSNLLRNGGFEEWPNGSGPFSQAEQETALGWMAYANRDGEVPVVQREQPSTAPAGSQSAIRIIGTSAYFNLIAQTIDPSVCALNNMTVSLSFLVNAPVGSQVQAVVGILGDVGYWLPQPVDGTGDWQTVRLSCTLPATPAAPVLVVLGGLGTFDFSFDNASLVVGATPTDYWPAQIATGPAGPPGDAGAAGPQGPSGVVQTAIVTATDTQTSTSLTPVIIPNSSVTITTTGGVILAFASASLASGSTCDLFLSLFQDGVLVSIGNGAYVNKFRTGLASVWRLAPPAGQHTYALGFSTSFGTVNTTTDTTRSLLVQEVRP